MRIGTESATLPQSDFCVPRREIRHLARGPHIAKERKNDGDERLRDFDPTFLSLPVFEVPN